MQIQLIQNKIYKIRGLKVMLDSDLAELYESETKRLKESVRRNIDRFPPDFMFELSLKEYNALRTQIATLKKGTGKHIKYLPFAFTEQGVAMLASVLNSPKAIQVNIAIVRAFVLIRQYALSHKDLTEKLQQLENTYNKQFKDVYEALDYLLNKDEQQTEQSETSMFIKHKCDENYMRVPSVLKQQILPDERKRLALKIIKIKCL